jgi:hypothetical protein
VLLCLCLLNAIDNPHRDIYLAGLLCSPLYGFTADDLVRYRGADREKTLFSALEAFAAAHPEEEKLRAFLSSLARYQLMAEGMRVDELLTGLYAESSLLSLAAKNGGRDNLLLLRDYAARYEAGGFSGLYSFIHYINNLIESRADFDSKRPGVADEDRVQLITVHASKGLEYPVCFIAGCGSEIRDQESGPFAYVEGFGLAFRLRDRSGLALVENPAVNAIARQRAARGFEEEGLKMVKAVRDRYDGYRRNPWNEMECGSNYARSMASFALLLIYSGIQYDMPDKKMGFKPVRGEGTFFWSLEGAWGTVKVEKTGMTLKVIEGEIALRELVTGLDVQSATAAGEAVAFSRTADGIRFDEEAVISAGESLYAGC